MHNMNSYSPANVYSLSNSAGLQLDIMDHGATWLSCRIPLASGESREVILGCHNLEEYKRQDYYIGATVGRFTNRIRNACFPLQGCLVKLDANEGTNQLHGGPDGFHRRFWHMLSHTNKSLVLGLISPDGDQGFPGEVTATIEYVLCDDLTIEICMKAITTSACPVGLTQHAYFNLDGDNGYDTSSCLEHHLQVSAGHWLPVDEQKLPLPSLVSVEGRGFDLREERKLSNAVKIDETLSSTRGFDHSLVFESSVKEGKKIAAQLSSSDGKVQLQLWTNQAALQIYTGQDLAGVRARDGSTYQNYAGIALETQQIPDSMNHPIEPPFWNDCILQPDQVWCSRNRFKFIVND